jgi:phage tail sheath gpL-like
MADGIEFNYIPGSGLTEPIFSFEVNSGGQYSQIDRYVLFGHASSAGIMAPNVAIPVSSQDQADLQAGPGSMLREMFRIAQANAPAIPIWLVAVPAVGGAPVWTISVGSLPGVGVGVLEIEGEEIEITIGATDTPTTIAAAIAAAINAYYNALTFAMLPVTATSATNVVTVTARHVGQIMNAINFYVPTPADVANNLFNSAGVITIARSVDGSGNPVVANALAGLQDNPADYIVAPWTDSPSLAAYTAALSDVNGRWSWERQSYGHAWTCQASSFAALTTLGLSLNDRHTTVIGKIAGAQATDLITIAGNPTNTHTLTINGTTITWVTSGATGLQVNIGSGAAANATALLALLNGSAGLADPNLSQCVYTASGATAILATAKIPGNVGNAIAIASTDSNVTVATPTLTGGLEGAPHASWLWAAGFSARVQPWLSDTTTGNVSRSQSGLVVQGLSPPRNPALVQQYPARNTLVNSGISTWTVGPDGSVKIGKIVTTYRTGVSGNPDTVFQGIQSMYQTAGALKYFRAQVGVEQANKALAPTNPGNLGAISTPADITASFVNAYTTLAIRGVLTNPSWFAQNCNVQINGQNPSRADVYAPLNVVNPLDILAANATIYRQFPQTLAA